MSQCGSVFMDILRASPTGYLNTLPILYLGSEGQKTHSQQATYQTTYFCWSNKFLLSLPTSVGLINMTTYFFSPSQRLSSLRLHARDLPVHMRRRPSPSPTPSIGPVSPTPPQGSLDAAAGPAPPHVEVRWPCSIASGAPSVWACWRWVAPPRAHGMPTPPWRGCGPFLPGAGSPPPAGTGTTFPGAMTLAGAAALPGVVRFHGRVSRWQPGEKEMTYGFRTSLTVKLNLGTVV